MSRQRIQLNYQCLRKGMDPKTLLNSHSHSHILVRRRSFVAFIKASASVVTFIVCIGSMMFVVNTNRKLQLQIDTVLKQNDQLTNRVKRDAIINNKLAQSVKSINALEKDIREKRSAAEGDNERLEDLVVTPLFGAGGVTYERWGRRDCSGPNNKLIYHGIAAGSWYAHTGGPSNHACLDMNVTYTPGRYIDGGQANAYFYGMEYRDAAWVHNLFDLSLTEGTLQFNTVPCAICQAKARLNKLTIPGRETCPEGWYQEYTGYMMSGGHNDKHSSNALCVDDTPQVVPGTQGNQNGAYLHMMEMTCTSILCEPFVNAREVRCVVCTV